MPASCFWALVFFCFAAVAQDTPKTRSIRFEYLKPGVLEERLRLAVRDPAERLLRLTRLFEESGCTREVVQQQRVPGSKEPNLICRIPASAAGSSAGVIVVGAHYDSAGGDGVIDNWSGAIILPSLFEMLSKEPRRHEIELVAFAAEEKGLLGSREYVKRMPKERRKRVVAAITLDSLGLTPTKLWTSHSDAALIQLCARIAFALKLDLQARNADRVGRTDSLSFAAARIPVLSVHSVTTETLPIINSDRDVWGAIKWKDYYDTYRLITALLVYIDDFGVPPVLPGEP